MCASPYTLMRIVYVSEPPEFYAVCLVCKGPIPTGRKYADLDGPAFRAYYHHRCLPADQIDAADYSRALIQSGGQKGDTSV